MKKEKFIILLVLLLLMFTGCGKTSNTEITDNDTEPVSYDNREEDYYDDDSSIDQDDREESIDDSADRTSVFADEVSEDTYESSTAESNYPEGDYDIVWGQFDDYYVVCKDISSFDSSGYEVGVIKQNGEWAIDYEKLPNVEGEFDGETFVKQDSSNSLTVYTMDAILDYWGNGVFVEYSNINRYYSDSYVTYKDCHVYSCENGTEFNLEQVLFHDPYVTIENSSGSVTAGVGSSDHRIGYNQHDSYAGHDSKEDIFKGEYNIVVCEDRVEVVTREGVVGEFDEYRESIKAIGPYSDGGFVYFTDELRFLDWDTHTSTPICKDSDKINLDDVSGYAFDNGKLDVTMTGSDGKAYYAIVDKNGKYVEEPHT